MNEDEKKFIVRAYTKSELAAMYNPMLTIESACQQLRRWIRYNKKLHDELCELGYSGNTHLLTPLQVKVIVKYIGEP